MRICVIAGTNRAGSNTLKLATRVAADYRALGAEVVLVDLQALPIECLAPTAYAAKPASFEPFAQAVLAADGLVVITPEYNGSFPGALKLFIDLLPFPQSFENRPVAFIGLAAGRWGALRPVEQLMQVFAYRNGLLFNERVFVPAAGDALGEGGRLTDPLAESLLVQQTAHFLRYCEAVRGLRG
ncbi:MAG: NAD(P)H-dependent oxidoreductase [Myxococcales bacterium]|nr:NAD(P)H-dependent oxidoreductase [Myxococcales bacterium]